NVRPPSSLRHTAATGSPDASSPTARGTATSPRGGPETLGPVLMPAVSLCRSRMVDDSAPTSSGAGPARCRPKKRPARFGAMSRATTALLTDRYELTMLEASLQSGAAHRRSVFEVFSRRLSGGRRYGVVAGTGRVLDAIADFTFSGAEIDWLREQGV